MKRISCTKLDHFCQFLKSFFLDLHEMEEIWQMSFILENIQQIDHDVRIDFVFFHRDRVKNSINEIVHYQTMRGVSRMYSGEIALNFALDDPMAIAIDVDSTAGNAIVKFRQLQLCGIKFESCFLVGKTFLTGRHSVSMWMESSWKVHIVKYFFAEKFVNFYGIFHDSGVDSSSHFSRLIILRLN